LECIWSR